MKHKLYKKLIYKVNVSLRVEKPEDDSVIYEYKSYNCPWIDIKHNVMTIPVVVTDYLEDLDFQRYDLSNIYTIDILKGEDLIQMIICNDRVVTPEEIKRIEEEMKKEKEVK